MDIQKNIETQLILSHKTETIKRCNEKHIIRNYIYIHRTFEVQNSKKFNPINREQGNYDTDNNVSVMQFSKVLGEHTTYST